MSKDTRTLHFVLSSPSAGGLLRQALRAAGRREPVIDFRDFLACGPIDPPAPDARLHWMIRELGYAREEWDWLPNSVNEFWQRATASAARRIVWTSSRCADEHAAFLAWIDHMGEQHYEVVDVADIEVAQQYADGRTSRGPALRLGMVHPDVIAGEALWDYARPLAPGEKQAHAEAWRNLRAENAPLRVIGPDGLRSAPITHFDNSLLSKAGPDWRKAMVVVAETLADEIQYFQSNDEVRSARLATLIDAGKLEGRHLIDKRGYRFGSTVVPSMTAEIRLPSE